MKTRSNVARQYKFKHTWGTRGLDAQAVGEAFEELRKKNNALLPADVVEAAKSPSSPMHAYFDWDDASAAVKHRLAQAKDLIRAVEVTWAEPKGPREVEATVHTGPAFVNTTHNGTGWKSLRETIGTPEGRAALLDRALEDLVALQDRYELLSELANVRVAIGDFAKKVADYKRKNIKAPARKAA